MNHKTCSRSGMEAEKDGFKNQKGYESGLCSRNQKMEKMEKMEQICSVCAQCHLVSGCT